jgi:hypothetical protein
MDYRVHAAAKVSHASLQRSITVAPLCLDQLLMGRCIRPKGATVRERCLRPFVTLRCLRYMLSRTASWAVLGDRALDTTPKSAAPNVNPGTLKIAWFRRL